MQWSAKPIHREGLPPGLVGGPSRKATLRSRPLDQGDRACDAGHVVMSYYMGASVFDGAGAVLASAPGDIGHLLLTALLVHLVLHWLLHG